MKPSLRPTNPATIWRSGDCIIAELPRGNLTHTVSVPFTTEGLAKIINLLAHRTEASKIGTAGEPTQHLINKQPPGKIKKPATPVYDLAKVRRVGKVKMSVEQMESTKEVLRKLGMI